MIDYCSLARSSLRTWLERGERFATDLRAGRRAGCFVTLHSRETRLRGCIGTIKARRTDLVEEVIENSVSAATRDPRFQPVTAQELPELCIEVSVLGSPSPINSPAELDPQRYGVMVEHEGKRGVLLPGLQGISSVQEQLAIAKRKALIPTAADVDIWRFEVEKYHE